jgi:TatD DNase family protein
MNPELIDTHCHVNFRAYQEDSHEVINRALQSGVAMMNVGTNLQTSQRSVQVAEEVGEGMWAAIGLHPIFLAKDITEKASFNGESYEFTTKQELFDKRKFFELAQSYKVVAVGESGLDYYHIDEFRNNDMTAEQYIELQKETLYEILGFAREIGKPHIFHCRDAYDDFVDIVKDFGTDQPVRGVVHCFTGTMEQAKKILETGLYIGFTGIATFPNAKSLQEIASYVPLDRMLIETDSPYLAPQAVRGQRNEPAHVRHVAQKIAELKGISFEEVAQTTTQNAKTLFAL